MGEQKRGKAPRSEWRNASQRRRTTAHKIRNIENQIARVQMAAMPPQAHLAFLQERLVYHHAYNLNSRHSSSKPVTMNERKRRQLKSY